MGPPKPHYLRFNGPLPGEPNSAQPVPLAFLFPLVPEQILLRQVAQDFYGPWRSFRKDLSPKQVSKHWRKHKGLIPDTGSMVSHFLHPPSEKWCCSLCTTSLTPIPFCNGREYHIKQTTTGIFNIHSTHHFVRQPNLEINRQEYKQQEHTMAKKCQHIYIFALLFVLAVAMYCSRLLSIKNELLTYCLLTCLYP